MLCHEEPQTADRQMDFFKITMLHKSVQKLGGGLAQNWGTCVAIMLSHLLILDTQPLQNYPHKSCQSKTSKTKTQFMIHSFCAVVAVLIHRLRYPEPP